MLAPSSLLEASRASRASDPPPTSNRKIKPSNILTSVRASCRVLQNPFLANVTILAEYRATAISMSSGTVASRVRRPISSRAPHTISTTHPRMGPSPVAAKFRFSQSVPHPRNRETETYDCLPTEIPGLRERGSARSPSRRGSPRLRRRSRPSNYLLTRCRGIGAHSSGFAPAHQAPPGITELLPVPLPQFFGVVRG